MTLNLKHWPDPILREECSECKLPPEESQAIGEEMLRIMFANNGAGLAAPQVGLQIRLFVMRDPEAPTKGLIFVNPNLSSLGSNTESDWEGCLSLPWGNTRRHRVKITRHTEVEFFFDDQKNPGQRLKRSFKGVSARAIQHELDHLDGIMIFDHIKGELSRKMYMQKYMKDRKKYDNIG